MKDLQNILCITTDELSQLLQVSRPTAYKLVHTQGFPSIRIGTRILIPRAQLDQWLADQTREGDKEGA